MISCKCGNKATWHYTPCNEDQVACDDCVPRGCSCNLEPRDGNIHNDSPDNWYQPLDDQGRKWPCCEWWQITE